jgi:hypothetical protein
MKTCRPTITYVPVENSSQVAEAVTTFLQENCTGILRPKDDLLQIIRDRSYSISHMQLELGGREPNPLDPTKEVNVECTFSVLPGTPSPMPNIVDDPNGDTWYCETLHAEVGWPSYGPAPVAIVRLRRDLLQAAFALAERFNVRFQHSVLIWTRGPSTGDKAEHERLHRQACTKQVLVNLIKEALHGNYHGMRVGVAGVVLVIDAMLDGQAGNYDVIIEKKTYNVDVYSTYDSTKMQMRFMRTA